MCDIEINGVKYRKKEQPKSQPKGKVINTALATMLMLVNSFEYANQYINPYSTPKKQEKQLDIDIVKEYGLIQQKKSTLSRSQREWVVYRFNRLYTKI